MLIPAAASLWPTILAPLVAFAGGLVALALSGRAEALRLRGRHRAEEQRKLQTLIGTYHGRLVEAAVDWDRRMTQLYASRKDLERTGATDGAVSVMEGYLEDSTYFEHPDPVLRTYGKFSLRDQYFFRSFVFRFVSLCALARSFESQAVFIDAQVARATDFGFLKYTKAFLWAITTTDLPFEDAFPSYDHIPSDYLRPVLDSCYQSGAASASGADAPVVESPTLTLDLARLDMLIDRERRSVTNTRQRRQARRVVMGATSSSDASDGQAQPRGDGQHEADDDTVHEGFGRILMLVNGLRKPNADYSRLAWDRLCVLHLLTLGFLDEFGYQWQRPSKNALSDAVVHITDVRTLVGLEKAMAAPLALARRDARSVHLFTRRRRAAKRIQQLLERRRVKLQATE